MPDPFTLRIFIPSGDPEGVRIVDRMNWTGRGYVVPRDRWGELKVRSELARQGIYVLLGYETDELGADRLVAYIGQTDNLRARIDGHDLKKRILGSCDPLPFGERRSEPSAYDMARMGANQRAVNAKRCRLGNRVEPSEPTLIESEKADTRAFLNEMLRLMPVLGAHIFEVPKVPGPAALAAAGLAPERTDVKDTIVVPAQREGFERAFLGQHAWWSIRVAEKHRANLKWIAAYQTLPVAAVTHIAEISHLEPYGDDGKYKVVLRGAPTTLDRPVPYGDAPPGAMQGPRYTTRAALLAAKTVKDIK